jgi:SAM-dependent methyltransferase
MNSLERFSNRVENYIKYRPHYPEEIIPFLSKEIGLLSSSVIADIGSGTGISSELFLKNGNAVYGIEPNTEMREAAEQLLQQYFRFHSIAAVAEATTLQDHSIDFIIAGQAFHWFDPEKSRIEFSRILKNNGWVVLIWNERQLESSPFLVAYEKLLLEYGTDYSLVSEYRMRDNIKILFQKDYRLGEFTNSQTFDYNGLEGRLLSSSYTPPSGSPKFHPMRSKLLEIFDEHNVNGEVKMLYNTEVYYGRL